MSTHARVGILNPDQTVTSIYVHFDGYPSAVWPTLTDYYTTPKMVHDLTDLGDLSILCSALGEKQSFNDPVSGTCVSYGRDRGEADTQALNHPYDEWPQDYSYRYLFADGQWLWSDQSGNWQLNWTQEDE